jgi:hypothetical protein
MMQEADAFSLERLGRILLLALDEVLGRPDRTAVLAAAGLQEFEQFQPISDRKGTLPTDFLSRIQKGLGEVFGLQAGRGLALRIGRVSFKYGLGEFADLVRAQEVAFRLLPLPAKIDVGSQALADLFNRFPGQQVQLESDSGHVYWKMTGCPLCVGRRSSSPCCDLAVGLVQEALSWASGGRFFQVEEVCCRAAGNETCTLMIDKVPLA